MSINDCDEIRTIAPEVALGIASGEDRARVLAHASSCVSCRRLLQELSQIADDILRLAPEREPSIGFETRVLTRLQPERPSRRRRMWFTAAAVLVAASLAAGAVFWATGPDRQLAAAVKQALAQAEGEYFSVAPVRTADGTKVGNLFGYQGRPSWLFVALQNDAPPGTYEVEVEMESGAVVAVGSATWSANDRSWGTDVDLDGKIHNIRAVRFVAADGEPVLIAAFPAPRD